VGQGLQNESGGGGGHDFFLGQDGLAQGLEFLQHAEVDLEVLRQSRLVERDVGEELRVVAEGQRLAMAAWISGCADLMLLA
jgi:hypothetical protein